MSTVLLVGAFVYLWMVGGAVWAAYKDAHHFDEWEQEIQK